MNSIQLYSRSCKQSIKLWTKNFHSTSASSARRPFTPGQIMNRWGTYKRLAPASLANVDVRNIPRREVPSHILRPPYAVAGTSSKWEDTVPINSDQDVLGMREAGKLAKEILTLGSTLCKVSLMKAVVIFVLINLSY